MKLAIYIEDGLTQIVLTPSDYKSGDVVYPYERAKQ